MEIGSTSSAGPATQTTVPDKKGGAISSDFETFLKMLTVQMRNQDPLNPVESADFAVQLATFSTVEQQVRTNDLLTSLGEKVGALGMAQLSGWIGMEARADMPVVFNGTPVDLTLRSDQRADTAQLVVRDTRGTVVQRQDIPPGGGAFVWAGVDETGLPLPSSSYAISTESYSGDELLATHPAEVHSRIVEARNAAAGTVLIMQDGQEIPSDQILGLREPEAPGAESGSNQG